jgi:hypothetical protein
VLELLLELLLLLLLLLVWVAGLQLALLPVLVVGL